MSPTQRRLFGIQIDAITMPQAVEQIRGWARGGGGRCRYVVTPNVDHTVLLRENRRLQEAYAAADLVLADGWPLVVASRWLGQPLPQRVAGSDLVPALFSAASADSPLRVYLLGAAPGVADLAADRIHRRWPHVRVVGLYSPPLGFEQDAGENQRIVARINEAAPELLILGLGAPKQECWIHQFRDRLQVKVALCAGATIDFLAEHRRRAPRWMQAAGLEWLYRVSREPRRLCKRYAKGAWVFPQIVWDQWRRDRARLRSGRARRLANWK
jgi:N-acetylglucosaminyldiphosphoundecaprenol N-acetyl-beta-D-mannosaminyltransferase